MLRPKWTGVGTGRIIVLSLLVLIIYQSEAASHDGKTQSNSACPGFVILPNGLAVLSQVQKTSDHATKPMSPMTHKAHQHGHGDQAMGKMDHKAMKKPHHQMQGHDHHARKPTQHANLMGYQHGQAIVIQDKMLCVPVGSQTDTSWGTTSHSTDWSVMAESTTGSLAHNSRANEALKFTIMKSGALATLQPSQVRVFVRMPHHDHRMAGGHGPANDPDVAGIALQPDKKGRLILPTLDFSMAGPWLVEVHIQDGTKTHRTYFAANVGEE